LQKIEALVKQGVISLVTPYQLSKINGENGAMKSIEVESIEGDKMNLEVDALLSFFGLRMSLGPILNWGLNIHNHHIEVDPLYHQTNIPGVYAVGDIATYEGKLKLILSGFAEVASALHHSYPRVFNGKTLHFQYSTNKTIC
jgi:thioredoxin reductase (NADPH)